MVSFISAVKYFVLSSIAIFCAVFLIVATTHQSQFGPRKNPLAIRVTSCGINIKPLEVEYVATNFPLEWEAEVTITNTKSYLEQVIILPFETFINYKGVAFSCGFTNETKKIPKFQQRKLEVPYTSGACDLKTDFMKSPVSSDFLTEMKKGSMNVSLTMNLHAYYKHDRFWGWDVWLLPHCESLVIEYHDGVGTLKGNGFEGCVIPPPERYI